MLKSRSLKLLLISVVMMVCMSSMVFATNSVPTLSDPNTTSGSTTNSCLLYTSPSPRDRG